MSNSLAIATVSAALAAVITKSIQSVVSGSQVLIGRPQATPPGDTQRWVQLCLYQVSPNAALRNADLPTRTSAGDVRQKPQVALDLHYLLAFYGDEKDFEPQRMLGAVTRDLHANPVLSPTIIGNAISSWSVLAESDLDQAIERVKLTQLSLSLEDLSKLWSVFFQTPYALSIAYHASVVLIEAEDTATPAPPVLQRGDQDHGVDALLGSFPQLETIHIGFPEDAASPEAFPSIPNAWLGLRLQIKGKYLMGDSVNLKFSHPRLPTLVIPVAAADRTATVINFELPTNAQAQDDWAAGVYSLTVEVQQGSKSRVTNQLSFNLAAKVTNITPTNIPLGVATQVTVTVSPKVLPAQTPVLLFESLQVPADSIAQDELTFTIDSAKALPLTPVYLRVDGVDSLPIERLSNPRRLAFANNQMVSIS
jgi:hypothetical protein